jgi:hypothetical protein
MFRCRGCYGNVPTVITALSSLLLEGGMGQEIGLDSNPCMQQQISKFLWCCLSKRNVFYLAFLSTLLRSGQKGSEVRTNVCLVYTECTI